jgi:hypothetical protein
MGHRIRDVLINDIQLRIPSKSPAAEAGALVDRRKTAVPIEKRNPLCFKLSQSAKIWLRILSHFHPMHQSAPDGQRIPVFQSPLCEPGTAG